MSRVSGRAVLGRLLAEFAIIFVGVVLAFQFENWREAQVDREREAEALVALGADFEANLRNLDDTLEGQRRTAEALHLWLLASAGGDTGASADSLSSRWTGSSNSSPSRGRTWVR